MAERPPVRLSLLPSRGRQREQRRPEAVLHAAVPSEQHVVEHRQVREQAQVLERAAHAHAADDMAFRSADVLPDERDRPEVGVKHAGDHVDHRALAGAIRPDQRVDVPRCSRNDTSCAGRTPPKCFDTWSTSSSGWDASIDAEAAAGLSAFGSGSVSGLRADSFRITASRQAGHPVRHDVEREQQQGAVHEVLDRRPLRQQRVDERQQDRADERPVQGARAAEQDQQQDEDRQMEGDEVGVDVLVLLRHQRARDAAGHGRNHEGHDLVAVDAHAHGLGGDLVRLQRQESSAEPAAQQVAQEQVRCGAQRDGEPHPMEVAERRAGDRERLDAEDPLRTAEDLRPLADELLDDDAEGQRDHGEIGPPDPQRRPGDQHAAESRHDRGRRRAPSRDRGRSAWSGAPPRRRRPRTARLGQATSALRSRRGRSCRRRTGSRRTS